MGLYIPKMEVPKDNCESIQQITITNNWIDGEMKMLAHDSVTNEFIGEVVEVTKPHGRLIDVSDLSCESIFELDGMVKNAPTVIKAEGE